MKPERSPVPASARPLPLAGLRVLDFSVQLPGPLATLFLAQAGATVVKVERPGTGDIARLTQQEGDNVEFALLNRGKKSIVLDLKSEQDRATALRLAGEADVLVEQFRPGAMQRLGLGYDTLREHNPRLIYVSISGYGQKGPLAHHAGHDLGYAAMTGLLSISTGNDGFPVMPPTQVADVGGGTYPAALNILLALRQRDATGEGCHVDIAMVDNVFTWMRRPLGRVLKGEPGYAPGHHPSAGALARYNIYETKDRRHLTVAAIEEVFWQRLCDLVELPAPLRDDARADEAKRALQEIFRQRTAQAWLDHFGPQDVCVDLVRTLEEAVAMPHSVERGVFDEKLRLSDGSLIAALPSPVARGLRATGPEGYPALGTTDAAAPDLWSRPKNSS